MSDSTKFTRKARVLSGIAKRPQSLANDDLAKSIIERLGDLLDCSDQIETKKDLAGKLSLILGEKISPKRLAVRLRKTAQAAAAAAMEERTELSKKMRSAFDGLNAQAEKFATTNELTPSAIEALALSLLNVERACSRRVVSKHWGEGVHDVDPQELEERVLDLASGSPNGEALERSDIAKRLGAVLKAVNEYDDSVDANLQLIGLAGKLVLSLHGRQSATGALAQVNLGLPYKQLMTWEDFWSHCDSIADDCDAAHGKAELEAFYERNKKRPSEQRLPGIKRIASYALQNSITYSAHEVASNSIHSREEGEHLIARAKDSLSRMSERNRDRSFELLPWARASICLMEDLVSGESESLPSHLTALPEGEVQSLIRLVPDCEDSEELVEAFMQVAIETLGEQFVNHALLQTSQA